MNLAQRIAKAARLAVPIFAANNWVGERGRRLDVGEVAMTIRRLVAELVACGADGHGDEWIEVERDDDVLVLWARLAEIPVADVEREKRPTPEVVVDGVRYVRQRDPGDECDCEGCS